MLRAALKAFVVGSPCPKKASSKRKFIPSTVHSFHLMASEMLAGPLSSVIASRCGIFPRRYVTFIREQGPAMLRLTTDPLPGSSLASHTLNSHFLDTWAIRLCTNTTDIPEDSQQLRTGQDGRGSASARVCECVRVGEKREIMV